MTKYAHQIESAVALRGSISVTELSDLLGVSDQTVRRIIRPLVAEGRVRKVHGAIVSNDNPTSAPFSARMQVMRAEKTAIAAQVAARIGDGDSLAIDSGSTSGFVAQALQIRRNLTVVTNSAFVASTLATVPGNRVFMAGSALRDHDGAAFDRQAFATVARMRVTTCILSAAEADPTRGFLTYEPCEADMAEAMAAIATGAVMALDRSKFAGPPSPGLFAMAPLPEGARIVTDAPPPQRFADLLAPHRLDIARPT